MTPEALVRAMESVAIYADTRWKVDRGGKPRVWYVIDESQADPSVGWPGALVSQHDDYGEAKLARAKAIIELAEGAGNGREKGSE